VPKNPRGAAEHHLERGERTCRRRGHDRGPNRCDTCVAALHPPQLRPELQQVHRRHPARRSRRLPAQTKEYYRGKQVRITGRVVEYEKKAEIVLRNQRQIQIVEPEPTSAAATQKGEDTTSSTRDPRPAHCHRDEPRKHCESARPDPRSPRAASAATTACCTDHARTGSERRATTAPALSGAQESQARNAWIPGRKARGNADLRRPNHRGRRDLVLRRRAQCHFQRSRPRRGNGWLPKPLKSPPVTYDVHCCPLGAVHLATDRRAGRLSADVDRFLKGRCLTRRGYTGFTRARAIDRGPTNQATYLSPAMLVRFAKNACQPLARLHPRAPGMTALWLAGGRRQ